MAHKRSRPSEPEILDAKPVKQAKIGHFGKELSNLAIQGYVESRAVEVIALSDYVKNGAHRRPFQQLPNHMRRRAMSHDIKRIPKRLQDSLRDEMDRLKETKRPSRKFRRRPSNLLSEYERRKRRISWLETHIWHAKRFKMVEKWGHRLANNPNDKSIRACYRAVNTNCLIQDVSFESYIELSGERQDILAGLSHLTDVQTGPTFASKMTADGTRQGIVTIYEYDSYPYNSIGQVTFLWKPRQTSETEATLWICCHPSFFTDALNNIRLSFETKGNDKAVNEPKPEVKISSLKDELVKVRLYGPGSNPVLAGVLKPASLLPEESTNDASPKAEKLYWWKQFYGSSSATTNARKQSEVWAKVKEQRSAVEVPAHSVLGLTVGDPRLLLPPKRNKVPMLGTGSMSASLPVDQLTASTSSSPLWDRAVREAVKTSKMSEANLNNLKAKQLIPGSLLKLGEESRIPVMLIQRPGGSGQGGGQVGYAGGWDLVLPAGWAMAFWVALVYHGARVGGLREAASICLQAGQVASPCQFPDSAAGRAEMAAELTALETKHERRPPAKRPNYTKLGVPSPFKFKGEQVASMWEGKMKGVICDLDLGENCGVAELETDRKKTVILRERKLLNLLENALNNKPQFCKSVKPVKADYGKSQKARKATIYHKLSSSVSGQRLVTNFSSALVPVGFQMCLRGVPFFRGHVCLPSEDDIKNFNADKSFGGPLEPLHKDPGAAARKNEKKDCLKLRKKKSKKSNVETANGASVSQALELMGTKDEVEPSVPLENEDGENDVDWMNHASRQIIGFVKKGDFDLGQGQGSGLAFVSVAALLELANQQKDQKKSVVLIRNPTSLQYRFARLHVII